MPRFTLLLLIATLACAPPGIPRPAGRWLAGAGGVQLWMTSSGVGSDTVVVVHGFPGFDHAYLAADLAPLARGRRLIFYDLRGGGRSSPVSDDSALGLASHVRDLEALRQALGLERMELLGHSGGAAIAAGYAAEHPDRVERLVLIAPPAPVRVPYGVETTERFRARLDSGSWRRLTDLRDSL